MRRTLLILSLILWGSAQAMAAAKGKVDAWIESERIEICHRQGGTPETCGDLILD